MHKIYYQGDNKRHLEERINRAKNAAQGPLARQVQKELNDSWNYSRLAGLDAHGHGLAALRKPRTGRYRGATGQPLDPFGPDSDCVRGHFTEITRTAKGWQILEGIRSSKAYIFVFHALGKVRGAPVRDILGVPDAILQKNRDHHHDDAAKQLGS